MNRIVCLTFIALTGIAQAHHGLDFLLVQDAALPAPWTGMAYANGSWSQMDSINNYESETGVQLGLTPWLAVAVGSGFEDAGDGWQWGQATPNLHLSLFRSPALPWLKVSLFAGYAFAEEAEVRTTVVMTPFTVKQSTVTSGTVVVPTTAISSPPAPPLSKKKAATSSSGKTTKHSSGGGGGGGPDDPGSTVHDHPVATAGVATVQQEDKLVTVLKPVKVTLPREDHRGVHRHGEEGITARLIIEAELSAHDKFILNLINFTPRYGRTGWGYAAGWRHEFTHHFATSVEAIGDSESEGYHEAVVGAHWSPLHTVTLKLGVGAGLSDQTPDLSIHTGLVWRF